MSQVAFLGFAVLLDVEVCGLAAELVWR